jgi:hypothetical protein
MVRVNPFGKPHIPNKYTIRCTPFSLFCNEDESKCFNFSGDKEMREESRHSFLISDSQSLLYGSSVF